MTTTSTTSICLCVQKRRRNSSGPSSEDTHPCWNLFARLAPHVALELYQDVVATTRLTRRKDEEERRYYDQVLHESRQEWSNYQYADINFLPLAVTLASGETVYTSYNGGDWRRSRPSLTTASHHDGEDDALGRYHSFPRVSMYVSCDGSYLQETCERACVRAYLRTQREIPIMSTAKTAKSLRATVQTCEET